MTHRESFTEEKMSFSRIYVMTWKLEQYIYSHNLTFMSYRYIICNRVGARKIYRFSLYQTEREKERVKERERERKLEREIESKAKAIVLHKLQAVPKNIQ